MKINIEGYIIETNFICSIAPIKVVKSAHEEPIQYGFVITLLNGDKGSTLTEELDLEKCFETIVRPESGYETNKKKERKFYKSEIKKKLDEITALRDWVIEYWKGDDPAIPTLTFKSLAFSKKQANAKK